MLRLNHQKVEVMVCFFKYVLFSLCFFITNFSDSESETEKNLAEEGPMLLSSSNHKSHLEKIKETDPEFFKFLQVFFVYKLF